MADNPEEPGVRCLRIELSLSPAMLNILLRKLGGLGTLSVEIELIWKEGGCSFN